MTSYLETHTVVVGSEMMDWSGLCQLSSQTWKAVRILTAFCVVRMCAAHNERFELTTGYGALFVRGQCHAMLGNTHNPPAKQRSFSEGPSCGFPRVLCLAPFVLAARSHNRQQAGSKQAARRPSRSPTLANKPCESKTDSSIMKALLECRPPLVCCLELMLKLQLH